MGYRSDMVLCIKKSRFKKLQILNQQPPSLFNDHFVPSGDNYDGTLSYFTAEGLKMYTSYPEVEAFYDWLDKVILPKNFHYIEAGEDIDDVTNIGELNHTVDTELYAQVVITYPGGSL